MVAAEETARRAYEGAKLALLEQDLARFYRVVFFGSARLGADSPEFTQVASIAKRLVEARNIDIVTGGGPGIMEAAQFGAQQAIDEAATRGRRLGTRTHSVEIELEFEQRGSPYAHVKTTHPDFTTRLGDLIDRSSAAYVVAGGYGTNLELAMLIQLKQIGHLEPTYPIIVDPATWKEILDLTNNVLYTSRSQAGQTPLLGEQDLNLVTFTNDPNEVVSIIAKDYDRWHQTIRNKVRYVKSRKSQKPK